MVSTYESLANVANVSRIPLIASDTDSVERGAIAALGQSYYDMGRQTGKIVVRILKGEKTNSIAPQLGEKLSLVVNQTSAQKQGAPLSDALKQEAKTVLK